MQNQMQTQFAEENKFKPNPLKENLITFTGHFAIQLFSGVCEISVTNPRARPSSTRSGVPLCCQVSFYKDARFSAAHKEQYKGDALET